jgi:glycine cleavage system aminomethyltransferase T
MNSEKKEYNFLKELNTFLDGKLVEYRKKIELLQDIVEVKQDLLDTINLVLPDEADRIITKSKKEDYIGSKMLLLEHQQSLLRKQVNRVIKGKSKEKKQPLHIEGRKGIVSMGE